MSFTNYEAYLPNYVNNKINTKVVNKSYNEEKTKSIMGIDNENLTKRIHKSKLVYICIL